MKRQDVKVNQEVAYAFSGRRDYSRPYAKRAQVLEVLDPDDAYRAVQQEYRAGPRVGPVPYYVTKDARKRTVKIAYRPRPDADLETLRVEPRELWSTWVEQQEWVRKHEERERAEQERVANVRAQRADQIHRSAAVIGELEKVGVRAAPAPFPATGITLSAQQAEKLIEALAGLGVKG